MKLHGLLPPARRAPWRAAPSRRPRRGRRPQHALVLRRARDRLRQWREGPRRLRPRLLATAKPLAMSQQPPGSAPKTFVTSWCSASNIASGRSTSLPKPIEWLTDNGSCYTAHETRRFARDIGLVPCTTPVESPQSNGMAEAFVRDVETRRRPRAPQTRRPRRHRPAAGLVRRTTTRFIRTVPSAIVLPASSSLAQPMRTCQAFRGQQHHFLSGPEGQACLVGLDHL